MKNMTRTLSVALATCLFAIPMMAEKPQYFPNSKKYKDTGAKPASGRSGSAVIQARALIGSDHVTEIQVTTAAPGRIEKIQLKVGGKTLNYNNLNQGGNVTLTLNSCVRGESIAIQAHVKGIDGKRTDVVSATTHVYRKLDLAVDSIYGLPPQVRTDAPVLFYASIREVNGDISADSADCLLEVDGVEVDRRRGISVNAGGTVDCEFSTRFSSSGTKILRVSVVNAVPADENPANNTLETSVEVSGSTPFLSYTAHAQEAEYIWLSSSYGPGYSSTVDQRGWDSYSYLNGTFGALNFPTASISVRHLTGNAVAAATLFDLFSCGPNCLQGIADSHTVRVSRLADGTTSFMNVRHSGEATYRGELWLDGVLYPQESYTLNGSNVRFGSDYEIHAVVADGTETYEAHAIIPLQLIVDEPLHYSLCYDENSCEEIHNTSQTLTGDVTGPIE